MLLSAVASASTIRCRIQGRRSGWLWTHQTHIWVSIRITDSPPIPEDPRPVQRAQHIRAVCREVDIALRLGPGPDAGSRQFRLYRRLATAALEDQSLHPFGRRFPDSVPLASLNSKSRELALTRSGGPSDSGAAPDQRLCITIPSHHLICGRPSKPASLQLLHPQEFLVHA